MTRCKARRESDQMRCPDCRLVWDVNDTPPPCPREVKRVIYLSGPMNGYPNLNYPLFHDVAAQLRENGHEVYNPAEFSHDEPEFPIRRAFSEYCAFICDKACTIVLLPGWERSVGATAESALAKACGVKMFVWSSGLEELT